MATIIDCTEEHPEYLFDHLTRIPITKIKRCNINDSDEARCVAIDPFTDRIYVLMYGYRKDMLIYSKFGEFLRSFSSKKIPHMIPTNGMAIHKNNVYIVSGISVFLHFKVTDSISLIDFEYKIGSGIGEFMAPRQLDISKEGDLYVADCGNNRVQILDGSLQYKRHISHHSMVNPCYLKLTPDEVYVIDVPNPPTYSIHIFSHMGEKLRSLILNEIPYNMRCRGFCVDTYGNIVIIDSGNSQIKFLTKEGNLFETMAIFSSIIGVAWMTDRKLIVLSTESAERRLEIYSYF